MNKNNDMEKCVFTIVAKNYIGLAQILMNSVSQYNNDVETCIIVADEYDKSKENSVIVAKNFVEIESALWEEMSLKYDLTEFCTAIKPFCFEKLFESYSKVIYLDPDILLYDSLQQVWTWLEEKSIALTPHVARAHVKYNGELPENQLLGTGVFNLGFCAMRKDGVSKTIVEWWKERLKDQCFSDVYNYLYTDQHWMDLIPAYFPNDLYVVTELGYNVAPWNFFEREIVDKDGKYFVGERGISDSSLDKLIFVHYSGYGYKDLIDGKITQNNIRKDFSYSDVSIILDTYREKLSDNQEVFLKYISFSYTYNLYNDGYKISYFHRRLFNAIKKDRMISLIDFNRELKKNKLLVKDFSVEKANVNNVSNLNTYIIKLNAILKFLFKLLGYKHYLMMIKAMRYYSRYENHKFLIDD